MNRPGFRSVLSLWRMELRLTLTRPNFVSVRCGYLPKPAPIILLISLRLAMSLGGSG